MKISEKLKELTGNSEREKQQREEFTLLKTLAEGKCSEFKMELENMLREDNKLQIVGDRAIKWVSSQHIDLTQQLDQHISEAIDLFFEGKSGIKDGFKHLIKAALNAISNDTTIGEDQQEMFYIYPENFAIVRVDAKIYKYTFQQQGIITNCKNVICYTLVKSIVDHTKLSKDELLYFITKMMNGNSGDDAKLEDIKPFITELISVWNLLDEAKKSDVKVSSTMPKEFIDACNSSPNALTYEELELYLRNN